MSGSGNTAFELSVTNPDSVALTFTSSDETVATVDEDGKVETLAVGSAVISVKGTNRNTVTCSVYVHALDSYEDSANVSADSTYDWVFAYDDEVEPKTALAVSNITLNEAATTDGVTAVAGEYDEDTGSITVEVTIPAGVTASTEYVVGAKVTVGESDETASVTLTVAE